MAVIMIFSFGWIIKLTITQRKTLWYGIQAPQTVTTFRSEDRINLLGNRSWHIKQNRTEITVNQRLSLWGSTPVDRAGDRGGSTETKRYCYKRTSSQTGSLCVFVYRKKKLVWSQDVLGTMMIIAVISYRGSLVLSPLDTLQIDAFLNHLPKRTGRQGETVYWVLTRILFSNIIISILTINLTKRHIWNELKYGLSFKRIIQSFIFGPDPDPHMFRKISGKKNACECGQFL